MTNWNVFFTFVSLSGWLAIEDTIQDVRNAAEALNTEYDVLSVNGMFANVWDATDWNIGRCVRIELRALLQR
jgi:hypothetical protein